MRVLARCRETFAGIPNVVLAWCTRERPVWVLRQDLRDLDNIQKLCSARNLTPGQATLRQVEALNLPKLSKAARKLLYDYALHAKSTPRMWPVEHADCECRQHSVSRLLVTKYHHDLDQFILVGIHGFINPRDLRMEEILRKKDQAYKAFLREASMEKDAVMSVQRIVASPGLSLGRPMYCTDGGAVLKWRWSKKAHIPETLPVTEFEATGPFSHFSFRDTEKVVVLKREVGPLDIFPKLRVTPDDIPAVIKNADKWFF